MIDAVSYQAYCCLLKKELICAMGCTEPIAIAYCAAVSRAALGALPDKVRIVVSGNIVKNVKSVIVPNTGNRKGLTAAAAIGILGGDEQAELEVISRVSRETIEKLPAYLDATTFEIVPVERGFLLDIEIICSRGTDTATARIVQEHTNIILVEKNGTVLYHKDPQPELADDDSEHLSLRGIYDFVQSCDLAEIAPLLERQIADNTAIAEVGLRGQYGAAIGTLLLDGGIATAKEKARAYASAGSDARMNGCEMPVVINSGSGNQGMTVSLPVIVYARELGVSHERLLRALLLSNLLSLHEKKSIGRLSAYCGAVSAGAAAGAGIAYLHGASFEDITKTLENALAMSAGIVCDGAKSSCAGKISLAVEAGIMGFEMAQRGRNFPEDDGLLCRDPENSLDHFGRLARVGMRETDTEIIRMMTE